MSKTISEIHEIRVKRQRDLLIRTDPSAVPQKRAVECISWYAEAPDVLLPIL